MVANALSIGIGRADALPVLGGEVEECQQFLPVLDQALGGFRILRLVGFDEQIERLDRILAGLGLPNIVQHLLCLGLRAFGQIV